jgi:uncharacterized protein YdeI (YjbR/CyaY-like superfamily)
VGTRDSRVDAYIERSADFAKPILAHIRDVVHGACPSVVETIKWGFPHFEHHGILCSMASFRAHCAFGFWHADMRTETEGAKARSAMGQFGRIVKLSDLPRDAVLKGLVRTAAELNASGVKPQRSAKSVGRKPMVVPDDLAAALATNRQARATFEAFSDSHKREYVDWIVEAKRTETRQKRLATAIEWMAEGKEKEWRYRQGSSE